MIIYQLIRYYLFKPLFVIFFSALSSVIFTFKQNVSKNFNSSLLGFVLCFSNFFVLYVVCPVPCMIITELSQVGMGGFGKNSFVKSSPFSLSILQVLYYYFVLLIKCLLEIINVVSKCVLFDLIFFSFI